jgi:hypothetical protein
MTQNKNPNTDSYSDLARTEKHDFRAAKWWLLGGLALLLILNIILLRQICNDNWITRLLGYTKTCQSGITNLPNAGDNDKQQLSINGTSLSITGGGSVDLSFLTGTPGPAGANGSNGTIGSNGATGATGPAGSSGPTPPNCLPGEVLTYSGGSYSCVTPPGTGTVTNITTTGPISGGPITTTGNIGLTNCPAGQGYLFNGVSWACTDLQTALLYYEEDSIAPSTSPSVAVGNQGVAIGDTAVSNGQHAQAFGFSASSLGAESSAIGSYNTTNADYSSAIGYANTTNGMFSTAVGFGSSTGADFATAVGGSNQSIGQFASSFGYSNQASALHSYASGLFNQASNDESSAVGSSNTSSGYASNTFGYGNTASGSNSSAIGYGNNATNDNATAIGYINSASGANSSAFGFVNNANSNLAVAIGNFSTASNTQAISLGNGTIASGIQAISIGNSNNSAGQESFSIGSQNTSTNNWDFTIGQFNTADGSVSGAIGFNNQNHGNQSYTLGAQNTIDIAASGSVALGQNNQILAGNSYALGNNNTVTASGGGGQAIGFQTTVNAIFGTAIGSLTNVNGVNQMAIGSNNIASGTNISFANSKANDEFGLILGNADQFAASSNAWAVSWNGAQTTYGNTGNPIAVAPASAGRIYFDDTLQKFQCSENTGAYFDCFGGAAPVVSADNGLTINPANNVQLGGALTQNTTITNTGFTFTVDGTGNPGKAMSILGDLNVTGVIDPTAILFSDQTPSSYSPAANNGYRIGVTGATQRPIFVSPLNDTTRTFEVRNAANTGTILDVDSLNSRVGVNITAPTATEHIVSGETTNNAVTITGNNLTSGAGLAVSTTNAAMTGNILQVVSNATAPAPASGIARFNFTGNHSGIGLQVDDVTTTGQAMVITASNLTTGVGLRVRSQNAAQTGSTLRVDTNSAGAAGFGLAAFNFSGDHTGIGLRVDDVTTAGNIATIFANSLTSGSGLRISSTLNVAQTGNSLLVDTASTSAVTNGLVRFNFTGAHTGNGFQIDDATTTGVAQRVTANSLTSGNALNLTSTSASRTGAAGTAGVGVLSVNGTGTDAEVVSFTDSTNTCTGNPGATMVFTCASDATLKNSIADSNDILDSLKQLKIRQYNWNSDGTHANYGVIAQEVEQTDLNNLVHTNSETGLKSVTQVDTWMLVKGLQEVDKKVEANQASTIAALAGQQSQIDGLKTYTGASETKTDGSAQDTTAADFTSLNARLAKLEAQNTASTTQNTQSVANAVFNGGVVTGDTEFQGTATFIATTTFKGLAVFKGDASFEGDVSFDKVITQSSDQAGTVSLPAGQTSVHVGFSAGAYSKKPVVNVTPTGDAALGDLKYTVTGVSTSGFTIKISPTQGQAIPFNWSATQTK